MPRISKDLREAYAGYYEDTLKQDLEIATGEL